MNLIVSGCSFTYWIYKTWADYTADYFGYNLIQQGHPGAGNTYIRRSITDYIIQNDSTPTNTLVMVMWSGLSRLGLEVSRNFVDLSKNFMRDTKNINKMFFVESGGMHGHWHDNPYTKNYFNNLYKLTDKDTYLNNTIDNIIMLKAFLEYKGIPYYFMSHCDTFTTEEEWIKDDYTAKGCDPYYDCSRLIDDHWIFNNNDSIYSFAKKINGFSEDNYHPSTETHEKFFTEAILPRLTK